MKNTLLFLLLLIISTGICFAQTKHKVRDKQLDEISGIAASRTCPGLYYVHNDSGGKSEVYLIDGKGKMKVVLSLGNITLS